jgi:hypothetical protein
MRKAMASNFQIYSYKTRDSLHLKLNGDFDGNSAHELINILSEAASSFWEIFIDTNGLKTINLVILSLSGKMEIKFHQVRKLLSDYGELAWNHRIKCPVSVFFSFEKCFERQFLARSCCHEKRGRAG